MQTERPVARVKTHVAMGLGMVACRQGKRVRFYGAASVVNEMLVAKTRVTSDAHARSTEKVRCANPG